jgi:predicted SPOUT superfamily RNA methylase MTH1
MKKDNVQWDCELLAVLSMYAETPIKKLKKTIVKLSQDLHIDLPSKP